MKYFLILSVTSLFLSITFESHRYALLPNSQSVAQTIDTSKYTVFATDSGWRTHFLGKDFAQTTLTSKEIVLIETLLSKKAQQHNNAARKRAEAKTLLMRRKFKVYT